MADAGRFGPLELCGFTERRVIAQRPQDRDCLSDPSGMGAGCARLAQDEVKGDNVPEGVGS